MAIVAIVASLAALLCSCTRAGFEARDGGALRTETGPGEIAGPWDGPAARDRSPGPDCSRFATALFCEDFEAPLPGMADTSTVSAGSLLERTTSYAHRGRSLHAMVPAGGGEAYLEKRISPVTSGELYMRAFVRVRPGPDIGGGWAVLLALLTDALWPKVSADLVANDALQVANDVAQTFNRTSGHGLIRDVWTCVALRILTSDTVGELELFSDGQSVVQLPAGQDTHPAAGFGRLRLGVHSTVAMELLMDEFVLDTRPIPCP